MANRKRIPSKTNIHPRLAELEDSETSEFVFPRERVRPDETAQLTLASDSVTVASDSGNSIDDDDDIFEPGLLLGNRYEITEHVHTGGMGHLYKATDIRLHGEAASAASVAIKVLRQRLLNRPDTRNLLEMEAARARQLSHPNVINVYDFDEHDGQFFLVMEWLDGKSVHELLERTQGKRLDPSFAWRVIDGAAKALQHAHENGVIHADVNPGNVFICDTQDIKLLDFGVARERSDEDQDREQSVWATPAYASPDVLDGRAPVLADDVFSLACVAYRLLAGQKPFGDMPSIEARRRDAEPEAIPGLADEDWELLASALDFDRSARPATVTGFLRNVAPATVVAEAPDQPADTIQQTTLAPQTTVAAPLRSAAASMTWQWGAAAGAGAAVVAGLLLWALWPADDAVAPAPEDQVLETTNGNPASPEPIDTSVADVDDVPAASSSAESPDTPRVAQTSDSPITLPETASVSTQAVELPEASAANPAPATAVAAPPAQRAAAAEDATPVAAAGEDTAQTAASVAEAEADPEILAKVAAPPEEAIVANSPGAASEPAPEAVPAPATDSAPSQPATVDSDDPVAASPVSDNESSGAEFLTGAAVVAAAAGASGDLAPAPDTPANETALSGLEEPAETVSVQAEVPGIESEDGPSVAAPNAAEDLPAATDELSGDDLFSLAETELAPESPTDGAPVSGTKVDTPPEKTKAVSLSELGLERYVEPRYPRAARLRDQAGYVDIRFNVYPDGKTGDIVAMQSSPPDIFERSAREAVSRWRFDPRDDTVLAQVRLTFDPNR